MTGKTTTPFGLYIHWPFCRAKCPYCDFNSHVAASIDHELWRESLLAEMEHMAELTASAGRVLDSIFIGGGTPSLMQPDSVSALMEKAQALFGFSDNIEITMEANPTSIETKKLGRFADAQVNRLSTGIQSLDDNALGFLGREHSATEALDALQEAQNIFPRVSADFIYALPGQTLPDWEKQLEKILGLNLTHLSLYQLTAERGTPFWDRHRRGTLGLPDDSAARELFDTTRAMCSGAGLPPYEISNFARAGEECRHNLIYWRAHDWLGIGPGARGRIRTHGQRTEIRCRRAPDLWLEDVAAHGHGIATREAEDERAARDEIVMMGLRLDEGIDSARLDGLPPLDANALENLMAEKLIIINGTNIRLTARGIPLLDSVVAHLTRK